MRRARVLAVVVGVCALALAGLALAAAQPKEISTSELKALMDKGADFVLINSLSKIEYDAVHIPGSINIPYEEMRTSPLMPKDKNKLIVFYCAGRK